MAGRHDYRWKARLVRERATTEEKTCKVNLTSSCVRYSQSLTPPLSTRQNRTPTRSIPIGGESASLRIVGRHWDLMVFHASPAGYRLPTEISMHDPALPTLQRGRLTYHLAIPLAHLLPIPAKSRLVCATHVTKKGRATLVRYLKETSRAGAVFLVPDSLCLSSSFILFSQYRQDGSAAR